MSKSLFTNVVSNVVLVVLVLGVCFAVFGSTDTATVFLSNELKPIYHGSGVKQVSLMFNVYWGTEYIEQILAILSKYDAKTTFFVGGCWASKNSDLLTAIVKNGHEIGNHGYYHKEHKKLTYQQNYDEISTCNKVISQLTGVTCHLFAPPSGSFSNDTLKASFDNNCKTIMWSRDTIDWRDKDSKLIFNRATHDLADGELVLLHPTACTVEVLDEILKYYYDNGFTVVPVSTNIGELWTFTSNTQVDYD